MSAESNEIEFVDRYGGVYPSPLTVCAGPCEGMGCYPVQGHDPLPAYFEKYPHMLASHVMSMHELTDYERGEVEQAIEDDGQQEDGYYFIRCGDCGGTGKIPLWLGIWRLPKVLGRSCRFVRHMIFERAHHMTWVQHVRLVFRAAFSGII